LCSFVLALLCLLLAVFGRASERAGLRDLRGWVGEAAAATLQDKRTSGAEQSRIAAIIMLTAVLYVLSGYHPVSLLDPGYQPAWTAPFADDCITHIHAHTLITCCYLSH
jgi:hypothetical protein